LPARRRFFTLEHCGFQTVKSFVAHLLYESESRVRHGYTGVAVVALHIAILSLALLLRPTPRVVTAGAAPIEIVPIVEAAQPKVHLKYLRRQDLSAHLPISPLPPALAANLQTGTQSSKPGNDGSAVDWTAEAHRAIKAYEIRRDRPPANVIAGATRDEWWPQRGHHAGERYKTESGDWIVWINSSCYQIAGWHSSDPATNAAPPHTICIDENANHEPDKVAEQR
jgi:hypothetical protein